MFCNYPVIYFTNIYRMPNIIQCSRIFLCFRIYLFKIYLKNIIVSILTFSVHYFFTISPNPVCLMNEKKSVMPPFPFISVFEGLGASLVAQRVKHLPAMWETWVRALGREDPLEKGLGTHCSILAWRIPWTEAPGGLQSMGSQRVEHDWVTNTFTLGFPKDPVQPNK